MQKCRRASNIFLLVFCCNSLIGGQHCGGGLLELGTCLVARFQSVGFVWNHQSPPRDKYLKHCVPYKLGLASCRSNTTFVILPKNDDVSIDVESNPRCEKSGREGMEQPWSEKTLIFELNCSLIVDKSINSKPIIVKSFRQQTKQLSLAVRYFVYRALVIKTSKITPLTCPLKLRMVDRPLFPTCS